MNPIEKLIHEYYPVEPYKGFDNCWVCIDYDKDKAEGAYTVFKYFPEFDCCIYFIALDGFDELLCSRILNTIEKGDISKYCTSRELRLVGGLGKNKYEFDNLAIVNYEAGEIFSSIDVALSKKFSCVFPVFDCELNGNETYEQVMIREYESLIMCSWRRKPSPKALIRYRLEGYKSKKYKLCASELLVTRINDLSDHEKYYIEILNYKEEYIKILLNEGEYRVISKKKELYFSCQSNQEIHQWIQEYLHKGIFVDGKELTHLERETLPD